MSEPLFAIWSIEHDAWWRPERYGYTPRLTEAGHYTREEADAIVRRANVRTFNECAIPVAALEGATVEDQQRLLLVASDKLEVAAAALQRFVCTGSPESYRQLAGIELEVRHAMSAVRDIATRLQEPT